MAYSSMTNRAAGYVIPASEWNQLIANDEANPTAAFTAKGDSFWGTGSKAGVKLAVGANGTVPVADSTQASGVRWGSPVYYKSTVQVALTNTSETTILTKSIDAGLLGTANALDITIEGTFGNTSGTAPTITLKLKYGATTLVTAVSSAARNATYTNVTYHLKLRLAANAATNAQKGWVWFDGTIIDSGVAYAFAAYGIGTAAEDSTAAKTLTVTAQQSSTNLAFTMDAGWINVIA